MSPVVVTQVRMNRAVLTVSKDLCTLIETNKRGTVWPTVEQDLFLS